MASGLLVTSNYDKPIGSINVCPQEEGPEQMGHRWLQRWDDGQDHQIGWMYHGFWTDGPLSPHHYTVSELNLKDDPEDRFYSWHEKEYSWQGTNREKYLSWGVGDREDFFVVPGGGFHFGQGARNAKIGKNEVGFDKAAVAPVAPGPGKAKIAFIADPDNPGKAMLVAYAGTSNVPTIIADNIGDGY